jgi:cytochrome c nitrite reductase small subunit
MQSFSASRIWLALLSVALGVLFGLAGYTFYHAQGVSYLSNDPAACVNCHIMREQYDGWLKSHHAIATCNDCHVPHGLLRKYISKAENGFWHSKGFTLQDFHEPIQIKAHNRAVVQENCVDCHSGLVGLIATHPGNDHQMLDCLHCHSGVGHGPRQ